MKLNTRAILLIIGVCSSFFAAILIIVAAGLPTRATYTGSFNADSNPVAPELNAYAPNFTAPGLDGTPFELADLRGQPVIINFWATWCIPCAVEMPELQALQAAHPNIQVIGVNLAEPPPRVAAWVQNGGYTFDILFDADGEIARLYALRGQPSTYIVTPEGVISAIFFGATSQPALENALAPFL